MFLAEPGPLPIPVEIVGPAKAIDGDTLRIGAVSIRLFGVDAPESNQTCTSDRRQIACGARAAAHLREGIGSAVVQCISTESDRYGRPIAVCTAGGRDLASDLVLAGWAVAFRTYSTRYVPEESIAKAAGRGLWGMDFELPSEYRRQERSAAAETAAAAPNADCAIKGNINAKGERIFHLPGSRVYPEVRINLASGERWFCSTQQALAAGWRPAR